MFVFRHDRRRSSFYSIYGDWGDIQAAVVRPILEPAPTSGGTWVSLETALQEEALTKIRNIVGGYELVDDDGEIIDSSDLIGRLEMLDLTLVPCGHLRQQQDECGGGSGQAPGSRFEEAKSMVNDGISNPRKVNAVLYPTVWLEAIETAEGVQ